MSTHTPGPWKASCAPFDMAVTAVIDGKSADLMAARFAASCGPTQEANIALAAAAPDLLEAAEAALQVFVNHGWDDDLIASSKLKSAIVKAKGGTP